MRIITLLIYLLLFILPGQMFADSLRVDASWLSKQLDNDTEMMIGGLSCVHGQIHRFMESKAMPQLEAAFRKYFSAMQAAANRSSSFDRVSKSNGVTTPSRGTTPSFEMTTSDLKRKVISHAKTAPAPPQRLSSKNEMSSAAERSPKRGAVPKRPLRQKIPIRPPRKHAPPIESPSKTKIAALQLALRTAANEEDYTRALEIQKQLENLGAPLTATPPRNVRDRRAISSSGKELFSRAASQSNIIISGS